MAKAKKKKGLSDSKLHTIKKEPKKLNSFEMHVNRRKHNVVGMKLKTEKGLPGISRSRAIKKRKETLLQEYKWKNKKNNFVDRRIGEKDSAMTVEDKIMARFTAERMKLHSKKSIFNLGDGEELTHRGETLTEIEKYDVPKSDDEFDDEEDGKLDADFVGEAHFGGGMFKKVNEEHKSRRDLIDELIADSKKRKAEKQRIREETLNLTEKLDSEWKELLPLVTSSKKTDNENLADERDKKTVSYDILSKQLKFEARGKPSDRLKSENEIAREERDKLEALEKQRLERMLGENKKTAFKHRSADDLDDGFELDDQSDFFLSYNREGMLVSKDVTAGKSNGSTLKKKAREDENMEEVEVSEEEEESESDEEIEGLEHEDLEKTGAEIEEDKTDEIDTQDSSDDELDHHLSDLKESDESDNESEPSEKAKKIKSKEIVKNVSKIYITKKNFEEEIGKEENPTAESEKLPFIIDIPNDYKSFENLIAHSGCATPFIILERMIKCNHPSLNSSNKDKLDTLFTYLLQYLEDSTSDISTEVNCFKILDNISPLIYDLAQWNSDSCASAMVTVITEKYKDFLKRNKVYPGLDTLIFLKLVSLLFSTSDYRHKVATPTLIFMQHMLASCRIANSVDLSIGLFISTLILEFTSFSKRFVPEVVHFIRGVLRLCQPKESKQPVYLPFRSQDIEKFNLVCNKSCSASKLSVKDLIVEDNSEEFKAKAISLTLQILSELCDLLGDKNGSILIFEPFLILLNSTSFSSCLEETVQNVVSKIENMKIKGLDKLVLERKRPKPLKLYEPRIEEIYSLKRIKPMGKEKQERAKLQHKIKREMKGALREIRRDASFLAKLKFKEIQKSDMERQRKVREILGSVAQQTGEVRKLRRKK